jgi:hypothetical protein
MSSANARAGNDFIEPGSGLGEGGGIGAAGDWGGLFGASWAMGGVFYAFEKYFITNT